MGRFVDQLMNVGFTDTSSYLVSHGAARVPGQLVRAQLVVRVPPVVGLKGLDVEGASCERFASVYVSSR
jgi:hypothetical protein